MSSEKSLTPQIRFKGFAEAWEQRKLGDIAAFSKGQGFSKSNLTESGSPVILYGRLYTNYETQICKVDTFVKSSSYGVLSKGGEVIVPASGETAEDIAVASHVSLPGILLGGDLNIVTPKDNLDSNFLALFITFGNAHVELSKRAQGKSVVHVRNGDLSQLNIKYPTQSEQILISNLFIKNDNLITLHQRKLDALKKIKSALLEKMFPKDGSNIPEIRFTGFTEAWEQRKFLDTFDFLSNNTLSRSQLSDTRGSTLNIHYGDVLIKFGELIDISKESIPRIANDSIADILSCQKLKNGDVVIADTAEDITVGKCSELRKCENKDIVSGLHTIACRPQLKFASGYLGYYMNSNSFHNQLLPLMQGTKVISISKSAIKNTEINYPNLVEQRLIGKILITSDNLITLHQREHF